MGICGRLRYTDGKGGDNMVELGKKIRVLRRNKQISQAQLAEVLSVSAQSISKWENGVSQT